MKRFFLMLSFFTRIPVGRYVLYSDALYERSLIFFPVTGWVIGALLVFPKLMIGNQREISALLTIIIYLVVTGGIHLDGLADGLDGLLSNKDKDNMLEIMKDSRIGTFGAIGLIVYFMGLWVGFMNVEVLWILWMPYIGKTIAYAAAGLSHYARPKPGMGSIFVENTKPIHSVISIILAFLLTYVLFKTDGIIILSVTCLIGFWILHTIKQKIDGMTGDTIGLMVEVTQVVFILSAAVWTSL